MKSDEMVKPHNSPFMNLVGNGPDSALIVESHSAFEKPPMIPTTMMRTMAEFCEGNFAAGAIISNSNSAKGKKRATNILKRRGIRRILGCNVSNYINNCVIYVATL